MEYIYKFIEYINESDILNVGLLLLVVIYLIYLYSKKEEVEDYLGLKLIGFYLLGAFTFNFNSESFYFIIPVGFIVYFLFMKNKERANSTIKKKASIIGLIIVCFAWVNSMIYNTVEYREREISIKNISIKTLKDDYEIIKKELDIDSAASVEYLDLEYNGDKIRKLDYTITDFNNKIYYVSVSRDSYSINTSKTYDGVDDTFMFGNMGYYNMDIETLLDVISNIKFKEYEDVSYYTVLYRNEENYYEDDKNLYTVDLGNYSTKKLNSKYPIYDAVDISHMPMKQVSDGSWTSTKTDTYLINYNMDEEVDDDSEN